jgi:hypothetical protein
VKIAPEGGGGYLGLTGIQWDFWGAKTVKKPKKTRKSVKIGVPGGGVDAEGKNTEGHVLPEMLIT